MKLRTRLLGLVSAVALIGMALPSHDVLAQQDPASAAISYVQKNKQDFGLTGADVRELQILSVAPGANGVTHVYVQQQYRGIDVAYGVFTLNILPDGSVLNPGNRFVANMAAKASGQVARKTAPDAAAAAADFLGLNGKKSFQVLSRRGGAAQRVTLSDGGVSAKPIEGRLVWFPTESGDIRLAWQMEVELPSGDHHWYAYIDAETGEALGKDDLVVEDSIDATGGAVSRPAGGGPSALGAMAAPPTFPTTDGARYFVYPYPMESPSDGDQTLVTDVAEPNASPLGWHDTGATQYTVTTGNNVDAYADQDANNVPDEGSRPEGGPSLVFDDLHDRAAPPQDSLQAAITNLFYWNNVMHDVTWQHGFDEASGNFQVNNFGRGGDGGDDVRAEAQDGSGTNNANFGTPQDGFRPRMQMFIWNNPDVARLTVTTPAAIADDYALAPAGFGGEITMAGLSGDLALVDDGSANPSQGCGPLVGFPAGSIAVVDRGACEFGLKGLNAQNAGAIGMVVINSVAGNGTLAMGGGQFGALVIIPAGMIGNDDGAIIRAELPGVTATMRAIAGDPDRDSDFDAGVISHEYGHGVSNRLTGGRNTAVCLQNAEQMGEGWSDWFGITLTTSPSDTALTPRGVGTYVIFEPADGTGIRPTAYSTDMSVSPFTYSGVANAAQISQPHGIGYIWNSMLWEVYWNLTHKHGYNPNIYDSYETGGNNLAFRLVMDGMKFQPCRPGFVDGRDAILAADTVLTGGDNQCEIWRGFAKRGLGSSASQGSSNSRFDGEEAFDLPAACRAAEFGGFAPPVAPAPFLNDVDAGNVVPVKFVLTGAGDSPEIDTQPVSCETLLPTGEAPIALASPGGTGLKVKGDAFHQNWLTESGWAGTCRALTVRIPAEAGDAVAFFRFD